MYCQQQTPTQRRIDDVVKYASFVVNGYAFTYGNNCIRVLNLNNLDKASVLNIDGEIMMTSMDDIEISIIQKYFHKNKQFL